ncbi:MAG: hypothetical protein AABM30_09975 [Actinomycetota bacterium]
MAHRAAAIAFVVLLAGCGSGKKEAAGSNCREAGGTGALSSPGSAETRYLTSVNVEALECADRVAFGFLEGAPSGYRVSYQPASSAKFEDGSGNPVEIEGSAFLVVRLTPAATAQTVGEELKFTYTGPRRLPGNETRHVQEVVKTGDFEAAVTWVIGLDEERNFVVSTSRSQLSVDIG